MHLNQCPQPPWSGQTETQLKKTIHKVVTWSHVFTPYLENDQTYITLRDNPNHNATPLCSHTTILSGPAANPKK
jgi:hypothetical protein